MKNKNERFKQFCHFAAGLAVLPFAFKLFEKKHFALSVVVLLAGIIFVMVAGLLEWLEKRLGNSTKLFYLLESIFLSFTAFIYFTKLHKKMPTAAYAVAGITYLLLFFYFLYDKDVSKRKRKKHHRRRHSHEQTSDISSRALEPKTTS
jgi:O-antigen/teichoic acid export membrane protein